MAVNIVGNYEPPSTEIETGKGTSTIVVGSIYGSTYGNGIDCKSKTTTTSYAYNSWQPPCEDIRTPQQSEDNTRSALHYYNENTHLLSLDKLTRYKRKRRWRMWCLLAALLTFLLTALCDGVQTVVIHRLLSNIERHLEIGFPIQSIQEVVLLNGVEGSYTKDVAVSVIPPSITDNVDIMMYSFTAGLPVYTSIDTQIRKFSSNSRAVYAPTTYYLSGSSMSVNEINLTTGNGITQVNVRLDNKVYCTNTFKLKNAGSHYVNYTCHFNVNGFYTLEIYSTVSGEANVTTIKQSIDVKNVIPVCKLNKTSSCILSMEFAKTNFVVLSYIGKQVGQGQYNFKIDLLLVERIELFLFLLLSTSVAIFVCVAVYILFGRHLFVFLERKSIF